MNENFAPRLLRFLDTAQCDVPDWLIDAVSRQETKAQEMQKMATQNAQNVMARNQQRA